MMGNWGALQWSCVPPGQVTLTLFNFRTPQVDQELTPWSTLYFPKRFQSLDSGNLTV